MSTSASKTDPVTMLFETASPSGITDRFLKGEHLGNGAETQNADNLPVHFFTIVLNGMPFMRHHLSQFEKLPFDWHWHIVEGLAELKHDTAWSVGTGGRITSEFHEHGYSIDGTTQYINELQQRYPEKVSIYRKPPGVYWDGKREMVNAPLTRVNEPCLLWQLDSDELWTTEQIEKMREIFAGHPDRHAAYVHCRYFVGPKKWVSTLNAWATQPKDWLRVWRFEPGMRWTAHEPPTLVNQDGRNIAEVGHFSRDETLEAGLDFEHPSYVTREQVRFKEIYYGYRDATKLWRNLQESTGQVDPADFLHWAKRDGALVEDWDYSRGAPMFETLLAEQRAERKVIVAADLAKAGEDLTAVSQGSSFNDAISAVFKQARPRKIIETGTYLGTGTTTIIAKAVIANAVKNAEFVTIEVNPDHHRQAVFNLNQQGLGGIECQLGLSVPRALLPTIEDIEQATVDEVEFDGIIVDHSATERAQLYYSETNFEAPDDLLGKTLARFNNRPDFVLLDSAGHMGNVEFNYVIERLEGPCYIALDDIHHIKHRRSYLQMRSDPRFEIFQASTEKFGFCVAKFTPLTPNLPELSVEPAIQSLIWLRGDSIGDAVMANGMLPAVAAKFPNAEIYVVCQAHLQPLYRECPYVTEVIEYNQQHAIAHESYRNSVVQRIQALDADLLLHSTYSRTELMEVLAILSGAKIRIAIDGDNNNIPVNAKEKAAEVYNLILASPGERKLELHRHQDFLRGLGIPAEQPHPLVWTNVAAEQFAEEFFKVNKLNPNDTIAAFAGAQYPIRYSEVIGPALTEANLSSSTRLLFLGNAQEAELNEKNAESLKVPYVNLSGRLTLLQSIAIIRRCRLVVGTESALAHSAAAVGVPHVVLVGGGHFGRFLPYSSNTSVVCMPIECYNCNWSCYQAEPYCLKDVAAPALARAIKDALESRSALPRVYVQRQSSRSGTENYPKLSTELPELSVPVQWIEI